MDTYSAFKEILDDQQKKSIFSIFLERDQSTENLIFYSSVEKFRTCSDEERLVESQKIYDTHLSPKSKQQINIDGHLKQAILDNIKSSTITPELFQDVQNFILKLIFTSSYTRFLRSSIFLYLQPLFSDNFVSHVDNQPLNGEICVSLRSSLTENTDWNSYKPKRKEMEISFKETTIINTNYSTMKFEMTEVVDFEPFGVLSWMLSLKDDRKEWDRTFIQGSIEQVIAKNTCVAKQVFTNPVNNMPPIVCAILCSWHLFEDGSIMLMSKEINHNKIEVTEAVSYEKQKIQCILIQPVVGSNNIKQSKIIIFLRQKLMPPNTVMPKEEMILSSKCEPIKRLVKVLCKVSKGKYKGLVPTPITNLYQFQVNSNVSLSSSENILRSNNASGGMSLDSKSESNLLRGNASCGMKLDSKSEQAIRNEEKRETCSIEYGDKTPPQTKARTKSNIKENKSNQSQSERRIAELEKENEGLKLQIAELKKLVAHYEAKG